MTQIEKLYLKLSKKPIPSDVTVSDLNRLLNYYGFESRQPAKGGSHHVYCHILLDELLLTIPKDNPVKKPYIRAAVEAVTRILELTGGDDHNGY
jgi:hypothetical protein